MFKRVTWLSVGLVAGFGASKWVERKARRRLARYLPAGQFQAGLEAADKAREAAVAKVADLRHAVEGGRTAMASREAELRRQLRLAPARPDAFEGPGASVVQLAPPGQDDIRRRASTAAAARSNAARPRSKGPHTRS
jgi:hypothetical protein